MTFVEQQARWMAFVERLAQLFNAYAATGSLTSASPEDHFEDSDMGLQSNPYRDENGEPLVNLGVDVESEVNESEQQHVLEVASSNCSKSSPTPVNNDTNLKCRKLVIKIKSCIESPPVDFGLVSDDIQGLVGDDRKRKRGEREKRRSKRKEEKREKRRSKMNEEKGEKRSKMNEEKGEHMRSMGKKRNSGKGEMKFRVKKCGRQQMRDHDADSEIQEMWDTIMGENSEAKEGELNREIDELFKIGKKKKKEKSPSEISLLAESVVAELNVAAREDAELNRQEKPAITKLRTLSLLTDIIPRKHLQKDLRHGVLDALRLCLEPLPDTSIPNITITLDLEQVKQRELPKKSGLGKAIMFYYKYDEETKANRKLAKELVEKWSRVILKISTRFEDMRNYEDNRTQSARAPPARKAMSNAAARASLDDDLRVPSLGRNSEVWSPRQHASRPEAMFMNFEVRPQSKVDPEAVRARAKQAVQNQPRAKLKKKLQQLSGPKRKQLQAVKPSAEGRGMVKYI